MESIGPGVRRGRGYFGLVTTRGCSVRLGLAGAAITTLALVISCDGARSALAPAATTPAIQAAPRSAATATTPPIQTATPATAPGQTAVASVTSARAVASPTPSPAPTLTLESRAPETAAPAQTAQAGTPRPTPTSVAATASVVAPPIPTRTAAKLPALQEYPVPAGSRPHDVAPAPDGTVWYTAQGSGELGRLNPITGATQHIKLGEGSAPHGVIVGPDGAPWVTDSGLNAIVRVDPVTGEVERFPLPVERRVNLNTATFDRAGVLWFTGQAGVYGRLDLKTREPEIFEAPRGRGPYGIATTPAGAVYYASLAGSHIARIDLVTGRATVIELPTPNQGARRVWADSTGRVWVSEWNVGQLGRFDPSTNQWREWKLPGASPRAYAVYVDERDRVWVSDFGANALVMFDPATEQFTDYLLPSPNGNVRQILGRPGEVWGAESGADKLVVIRA